ncbi:hypothetical protein BDV98DRAFT_36916 [Pterulicium gracile]|uniref:FAD-binding domain-containing protein n=1 Tax=Pterulicium gracile TaxID=1884261 RepID=A0A5C3R3H2_9AGAR|nr:hypothetical protein BDV98DRAFT_36916 [Pterula gracilis]
MGIYWSRPLLEQILSPETFSLLQQATADPTLDHLDEKTGIIPLHNGETGEWIHDIKLDWPLRLSRCKIRKLLCEGLNVQWGKFLDKIDMCQDGSCVTAIFQDGTSATGTMIVACDGGRSIVRQHAVPGPDAHSKSAPFVGVRSVFELQTDERALKTRSISPVTFMSAHPKGMWSLMIVLDVPDNANPKDCLFQTITSWAADKNAVVDSTGRYPDVTIEELQARQRMHGGLFGDIFKWAHELPPEDIAHNQIRVASWPTRAWNSFGGRMVLVGDAAHPMPFFRGQGLNNVIADVALLVDAMSKVAGGADLKEELERCNGEIVERGFKAVNEAVVNCEMVHNWVALRQSDLVAKGPMHV